MLHREWSLWHQMKFGFGAETQTTVETECELEREVLDEKCESPLVLSTNGGGEHTGSSLPRKVKWMVHAWMFVSAFMLLWRLIPTLPQEGGAYHELSNVMDLPQDISMFDVSTTHETIEIPFFPAENLTALGEPVYATELVNSSFGQSWGHIFSREYAAPNVDFNKVILTLDVNVTGVQYDRLINIYLEDVELWRSSTIEPAGQAVHSMASKDVSQFASLFKSNGTLKFQLDNIINSRLTGVFDVSLKALFYNVTDKHHMTHPNRVVNVLPLSNSEDGSVIHIPDSLANVKVPYVNYNTTKLQLQITTSGNAEEEFWYSNVLDELKASFPSHKLSGHGPCRVVNVFLDGIRVHSSNPRPVIYTGGISPALWNPIVSDNALHIDPLSVDLTPVLPWLWESPDAMLSIEISNCLDDDVKAVKKSGIGSNWITSAALKIWEDPSVVNSYGEVVTFDNSTKITGFGTAPPFAGILNQVVTAKYTNALTSNITLVYDNGTEVSTIRDVTNKVKQTALTFMSHFGDIQSMILIPKTNNTFTLLDGELNILNSLHFKESSPLKIDMNSTSAAKPPRWGPPSKGPSAPADINVQVNLTKARKYSMSLNDLTLLDISAKENGTSSFVISSTGNHGTGDMEHKYSYMGSSADAFQRHALASNGTVIYDNVTTISKGSSEDVDTLADLLEPHQLHYLQESFHCHKSLLDELLH